MIREDNKHRHSHEKIQEHSAHDHHCSCESEICEEAENQSFKTYLPAAISFVILISGLILDHFIENRFFIGYVRFIWYLTAYIPVGFPVLKEALEAIKQKEVFTEFTLMSVATIGAFCIGEFPEAVAVMLFYSVGELFQEHAVNRSKRNIKALLDVRPDTANVLRNGVFQTVKPETVKIGETIQIKAGEKVPLDGELLSVKSCFNTSALTGESRPKTINKGETVLAGMLNINIVIEIKVSKEYTDSSLAKILDIVQNATSRKAKTELLIRKFAKIYTPIVFALAVLITVLPIFFVSNYIFSDWLYRGLVFLVISCPCALVISIPLGYFGGIGAASRCGVLFKGANYLELMTKVNTVVMDKTGTLTEGVFQVKDVYSPILDKDVFVGIIAAIESQSTHPIAKAITEYAGINDKYKTEKVQEVPGHGLEGSVNGREVLVGNSKLLKKFGIKFESGVEDIVETTVIVAIDGKFAGYITIADKEKEDAAEAVKQMHEQGVRTIIMLSGDKDSIVQQTAQTLGIDKAYGDLLPEDKVKHIEELKADTENVLAFVGDGINDAPALALSDVGIAMGGMGSDAAIEVADVVIQTDQPSKIPTAIRIAKATRAIINQNLILAITVKVVVLILGAVGFASMWGAVFADVGVALLCVLNSVKILRRKFD